MRKDTLFAVVALILILKLHDWSRKQDMGRTDCLCLFSLLAAMGLLRNNGIYVATLTLLYAIAVFKPFRK